MSIYPSRSLVSVVVPAYNAAQFVGRTVSSALAQTHRALEILVVDDGSTDATAAIVESMARHDTRIKLLQQENSGVAEARNLGLLQAEGDFVATLDADDLWHPMKIERQLARFGNSSRELGLVYCWYCTIGDDDRMTGGTRSAAQWMNRTPEGRVLASLVYGNFVGNGSTPLIRRECFERIGYYDASFRKQGASGLEDMDLYLRLAEYFEFGVVPEFLVGYRQTANSLSMNVVAMRRGHELTLAKAYRRNPDLPRVLWRWSTASLFASLAHKQYQQKRLATST